jgi:hypothetical protein
MKSHRVTETVNEIGEGAEVAGGGRYSIASL